MIEDVLQAMKDLLEQHLTDQLARQDGKYKDGIKLEPAKQIVLGNDFITEKGLPVVVLMGQNAAFDHMVSPTKKDVRHTVLIGVAVTDTDVGNSQKRLWRTIRAVESVFEIYASNTTAIINYQTEDIDYDVPVQDLDENSTEQGGQITATILERQDAYVSSQL